MKQKQQKFIQNLEKSLSEQNSHDLWAQTYEADVAAVNYQAPELLATTALELKTSGQYLDIGCGTGLVGEAIMKNQKEHIDIDGCDLSVPMLDIARRKGVYRELKCCNVFDMPYADASYDMVISVGVFMGNEDHLKSGSANAQALPGVIRVLKSSGLCVISVSQRVWETDSGEYKAMISQLPVNLLHKIKQPYHDAIPTMFNIVLQKK
jgi:predicted TPR repeat methyltransferase